MKRLLIPLVLVLLVSCANEPKDVRYVKIVNGYRDQSTLTFERTSDGEVVAQLSFSTKSICHVELKMDCEYILTVTIRRPDGDGFEFVSESDIVKGGKRRILIFDDGGISIV